MLTQFCMFFVWWKAKLILSCVRVNLRVHTPSDISKRKLSRTIAAQYKAYKALFYRVLREAGLYGAYCIKQQTFLTVSQTHYFDIIRYQIYFLSISINTWNYLQQLFQFSFVDAKKTKVFDAGLCEHCSRRDPLKFSPNDHCRKKNSLVVSFPRL